MFFVIGYPRSGTKLLRELLKTSSDIFIPEMETHILPTLLNLYKENVEDFTRLEDKVQNVLATSSYTQNYSKIYNYRNVKFSGLKNKLTPEDLYFLTFIKPLSIKDVNQKTLIGDKTPLYLYHIVQFISHFNNPKFIHIIRDPRDCVLSEQQTWGKSLIRSAMNWSSAVKHIDKLIKNNTLNRENYFELKYEDLLLKPELTINNVLSFLGLPVVNEDIQLKLKSPVEPNGNNSKSLEINNANIKKYVNFDKKKLNIIENIFFKEASNHGYLIKKPSKSLNFIGLRLIFGIVNDFFSMAIYHMKHRGIIKGVFYYSKITYESFRSKQN